MIISKTEQINYLPVVAFICMYMTVVGISIFNDSQSGSYFILKVIMMKLLGKRGPSTCTSEVFILLSDVMICFFV